jgi:hypothetical protein
LNDIFIESFIVKKINQWLSRCSSAWFVIYATTAAFLTYFSMYAFRKTFSVADFADVAGWDYQIDFKTTIILAQVIGYALSKFIGIKVVSEMNSSGRAMAILALVMTSQLALILFAILPNPYKPFSLFLNGLPLGMIWGLVFSFLEGRRVSEILGMGLSISFIVSSGVVKSVGQWLMLEFGVSEFWMPATTGFIFTIPLFISVFFLSQIPPPNLADQQQRHIRQPMNRADRKRLFFSYLPGLIALILSYMLLTAIRDYSDNFAAEIWSSLGYGDQPSIFSHAALYTSLAILVLLSCIMLVKDNVKALLTNHGFILVGIITIGLSTLLFEQGIISGEVWMITHSTGIYLAYIPFNCLLFDRMLAVIKDKANAGFLIYMADAMGYAGSVGILLYKNFFNTNLSWLSFMIQSSYLISIIGSLLIISSAGYFILKLPKNDTKLAANPTLVKY